jgi:carbamoyltransferase
MRPGQDSPYMLLVAPVREEQRTPYDASDESVFGIDRLNRVRSTVPAITHVDYSARVQTVDRDRHPLLHRLMECFRSRTGASFNVRGEPIVCTPEDAYRCFLATDMDVLVMGRQVLLKRDQKKVAAGVREKHLAQFQLD